MDRWRDTYLTRDEVRSLLAAGSRWSVSYCEGSSLPPVSGRGLTLPAGVLERVPTQAAKRRLQRGTADRSYFRAEVLQDASMPAIRLVEDL